jgi:SNF2 family DNA or RNA helicase
MGFVRLDGSMSQPQRTKSIQKFREDPDTKIFLVSMKAGGLGLNLVHGERVYMLDPWWNPATENQAIDRVHRLGQTKPVIVTKFIIAVRFANLQKRFRFSLGLQGSIEERILDLCEKKKVLAQGALGLRGQEVRQIRLDELRLLFSD